MSVELTPLPARWTDENAKRAFDYLQDEIARAFIVPREMVDPDFRALEAFKRAAFAHTALMRQIAMDLVGKYTVPQAIVRGSRTSD